MAAETEILSPQSMAVQRLFATEAVCPPVETEFFDFATAAVTSPIFREVCGSESVSVGISLSESVSSCSTSIQASITVPFPSIRSGSHTDIGPRASNEDDHICIDDLSPHFGPNSKWPVPRAFYALFDGHGGSQAASYLKNNATTLFFNNFDLPQTFNTDENLLRELEIAHRKAFLQADKALAEESTVCSSCGTTALTALILGRNLLVANAGDSRAVLCRSGTAVQLSRDHRPSNPEERKRVEKMGGFFEFDYLNGELSVTRSLGDWFMKPGSPLSAEPDVAKIKLTEEDEFLIMGCDGIWDVVSNQEAVGIVRRGMRRHGDPRRCALELVDFALRVDAIDNVTAVVVCFGGGGREAIVSPRRPRLRCCSLSDEARSRLRSLLQGN